MVNEISNFARWVGVFLNAFIQSSKQSFIMILNNGSVLWSSEVDQIPSDKYF